MFDAAARAAARDITQFDAELARMPPHRWRCERFLIGSRARWRCSCSARWRGSVAALGDRCGCSGGRRRCSCCLCHLIGAAAIDIESHQLGADGNHVARLGAQCNHLALYRRRNLDRRFIGHHIGERLIFLHLIARLDMPGDHFDFGNAFTDIRHLDHVDVHALIARFSAAPTRAGPGK